MPKNTAPAARERPLAGIRVLDFTHGGAGPLLTKTLGDFGADVVKVESRDHLDFPRTLPPYADKIPGVNRSSYFTNRNSSKKSIVLDLKHKEGFVTAKKLALQADVIVNSFRGGVLEGLGLGYAAIASENPGVIHVSMPMMPTSGPSASHRGVGRTITGMTGIHALTGYADGEITGPGTHFPDHAANPGHGLVAILSALYDRRRTGKGACIELAQVHSTLQLLGPYVMAAAETGENPQPVGNQTLHDVYSSALLASDGWYVVTVHTVEELRRVEDALSNSGAKTRLNLDEGRQPVAQLDGRGREELQAWSKMRTRAECVDTFRSLGLACAPVEDAKGIAEGYPDLWEVGHLVRLPHPEMGDAVYNAPLRRRDGLEPKLERAPVLGEHAGSVLGSWLGYDEGAVERLRSLGAIE
jgi:benzylsuccinate CoA-transferase BbsF subunit